jgi:hypothetical protein
MFLLKAPEDRRTPRHFAIFVTTNGFRQCHRYVDPRGSVLDCGGPPPLFPPAILTFSAPGFFSNFVACIVNPSKPPPVSS